MRPQFTIAALLAGLALAGAASADPRPAEGYGIEILREDGAVFSGLARDGDDLLVTDLGRGGFYRLGGDRQFVPFGPTLPHGPDVMGDPTGPYGIARYGENYLVAQGWTPVDDKEGPHDHALIEIDQTSVVRVIHRDFWNPFRFRISGDGIYVVDSGRNSIERLTGNGAKTTVFNFQRLKQAEGAMQSLSPTEFSDQSAYEVDAVPTGLAIRNERLYVSLFGGFPFLTGGGKIVSLPESPGDPIMRVELENLNAPVDLAFDGDGGLFVLEHGTFDQASGFAPGSGRLLSLDKATGDRRVLLDGLTRPTSVLLLNDRELVVSELGGTLIFLSRTAAK